MNLKDGISLVEFHLKAQSDWSVAKGNLEAHGVRFGQPIGTHSIEFCGIRCTSTAGKFNLLRAWLSRAEKAEGGE